MIRSNHRIVFPLFGKCADSRDPLKLRARVALYVDNCWISSAVQEALMSFAKLAHRAPRLRAWIAAASAALILGACAAPDSLTPGATEKDVLGKFGKPDSEFALPDGGKRFEYNRGEWMQRSWMVDLDRDGRVARVDQVRDEAHFARLQPGSDNQASVRRDLGTPWKVEYYPPSKLTGWLYPYRESGVFNSVMTVMFDPAGVFRRAENGPDPRFLANDNQGRN
jgi:hypothetical protein